MFLFFFSQSCKSNRKALNCLQQVCFGSWDSCFGFFGLKQSLLGVLIMSHTRFLMSRTTLCSCLNFKELLARNRRDILSLSECNGIRTHNHLVHKRTLNHLTNWPVWLNVRVLFYELNGCGFESCSNHRSYLN